MRVNLGLFQHDVNVIWDLAVTTSRSWTTCSDEQPVAVSATGAGHVRGQPGEHRLPDAVLRRAARSRTSHVNWLAPVKVRRTLIGGSRKMIVYDDLEPSEKVKVYDKGMHVTRRPGGGPPDARRLSHRRHVGAAASVEEALLTEVEHFVDCIDQRRATR